MHRYLLYVIGLILIMNSCTEDLYLDLPEDNNEYLGQTEGNKVPPISCDLLIHNKKTANTRGISPSSELINAIDSLLVINTTKNETSIFYLNKDSFYYEGELDISELDEVVAIYPATDMKISDSYVTCLSGSFSLSKKDLLQKSCYWAFTTLYNVQNKTSVNINLYNLKSYCSYKFTDENGLPLMLKKVIVTPTKGTLYYSRDLNLLSGQFENSVSAGSIEIKSFDLHHVIDDSLFISFFPTSAALQFVVTDIRGNEYVGHQEERRFVESESTNQTVSCTLTKPRKEYVEVCGTKWAVGNLIYDENSTGDEGFFPHWKIADSQWYYPDAISSEAGVYVNDSLPYNPHCFDVFNWGSVGESVFNLNTCARPVGPFDISKKLFLDTYCQKETSDYESAKFGDLPFWASKGRFRMPSYDEMYKLYNVASYSIGYAPTDDGRYVWGYLFTSPEGQRAEDKQFRYFTETEIENGLFLPGAGFRQLKSPEILRAGSNGFYWNSFKQENGNIMTLRWIWKNIYWSGDAAAYGRTIRPVLDDENAYVDVDDDFIEVCGVKWAKGNLQYAPNIPTSEGFIDNWSIAANQWESDFLVSGFQDVTSYTNPDYVTHFNWGVCGTKFLTNNGYANTYGDISGQMFTDRDCKCATTDFTNASYGDLAFWASKGTYRMPTKDEMYKLFNEASYSYGCYESSDGIKVFGYLFWDNPDGRIIEKGMHVYTDYDLEHRLFLPALGNRQAKSEDILRIGNSGYYWHSERDEAMNQFATISYNIVWRSTSPNYGRSIRPVKIQKY